MSLGWLVPSRRKENHFFASQQWIKITPHSSTAQIMAIREGPSCLQKDLESVMDMVCESQS
jgi:hypothetical protein